MNTFLKIVVVGLFFVQGAFAETPRFTKDTPSPRQSPTTTSTTTITTRPPLCELDGNGGCKNGGRCGFSCEKEIDETTGELISCQCKRAVTKETPAPTVNPTVAPTTSTSTSTTSTSSTTVTTLPNCNPDPVGGACSGLPCGDTLTRIPGLCQRSKNPLGRKFCTCQALARVVSINQQ
jgi:hypothetical protein